MDIDDLNNRFTYHPPKENQQKKYIDIRQKTREFVELINNLCPEGREKSLAVTKLEEVVMWANASIARN